MDYSDQSKFFARSRQLSALSILLLVGLAAYCARGAAPKELVIYGLITTALAISLYYSPDYLHLTVDPAKRSRWATKIRWRIAAAVFIVGLALFHEKTELFATVACATWIAGTNVIGKKVSRKYLWLFLFGADLVMMVVIAIAFRPPASVIALIVAFSLHLAFLISDRDSAGMRRFLIVCVVLPLPIISQAMGPRAFPLSVGLLFILSAGVTAGLVLHTRRQHVKNEASALEELVSFSGHSPDEIRKLWATANEQLARNFESAAIPPQDQARLLDWYQQNSTLYLYALSAYNLEYKRIRASLNVLKLGRGACLDYGAGNGDILIELARHGQRADYFDVEGETMRFARHRAQRLGLNMAFFHKKEDLLVYAGNNPFDAIFALDVLEHIPDLAGELNSLASMLAPGGLLVFDVPAGATKSHPMHLEHNLDVVKFLTGKGLRDERNVWQRLPWRKEEKFFFRAPERQRAAAGKII